MLLGFFAYAPRSSLETDAFGRRFFVLDILLVTGSYVLVILIGSICAQSGFIASETKNVVSKMLFYITLPATVIYSFVGFEFDATLLIASAIGLASTLLGFFGTVLYTCLLYTSRCV